jgi:uncharacterized protein
MKHETEDIEGLVNSNLFVISRDDGRSFLLYSPLNRKAGVINTSGAGALSKFFNKEFLTDAERHYIRALYGNKFLNREELPTPVYPDNHKFLPHEVTLFATSRCNLRCRYCYADAGKKSVDMKPEIARAAIDLIAENAGLAGLPGFAVGFHGGGEPTVAWHLVKEAVLYAEEVANLKGLDVEIFAATNGMFSRSQRAFIAAHFSRLNISIDGPADIQNFNRPAVHGGGSFDLVRENLRFLDEQRFPYGVRATVTQKNVSRMVEMVEWFAAELKMEAVHIEPVWQCGRCLTSSESAPSDEEFIHYFSLALNRAEELNIKLIYSGLRLDSLLSKFCAAAGDGFNVLPEGTVTSCYEITEADDPKAVLFHFGRYDAEKQKFVFDTEKLHRLKRYSVEHFDYCGDCFCKWHCAGDCISKVFDEAQSFEHAGSARCNLNRQLTRLQLEKLVSQTSKYHKHQKTK